MSNSDLSKQPEEALKALLDEITEAERTYLRHIEYLRGERYRILAEMSKRDMELYKQQFETEEKTPGE